MHLKDENFSRKQNCAVVDRDIRTAKWHRVSELYMLFNWKSGD